MRAHLLAGSGLDPRTRPAYRTYPENCGKAGGIYFDGESDEMNFDAQYAWWDDYEANSILSTALVADEEVMQAYYENYSAQIESKIEFGEIESGECKLENGMLWATMSYQERA